MKIDVTSAASWDYSIAETVKPAYVGDESRPAIGIATGVVLSIPCWAIIIWIVHLLWA